jgi:hypothetical protein
MIADENPVVLTKEVMSVADLKDVTTTVVDSKNETTTKTAEVGIVENGEDRNIYKNI